MGKASPSVSSASEQSSAWSAEEAVYSVTLAKLERHYLELPSLYGAKLGTATGEISGDSAAFTRGSVRGTGHRCSSVRAAHPWLPALQGPSQGPSPASASPSPPPGASIALWRRAPATSVGDRHGLPRPHRSQAFFTLTSRFPSLSTVAMSSQRRLLCGGCRVHCGRCEASSGFHS